LSRLRPKFPKNLKSLPFPKNPQSLMLLKNPKFLTNP
jgi:hypothetical protein